MKQSWMHRWRRFVLAGVLGLCLLALIAAALWTQDRASLPATAKPSLATEAVDDHLLKTARGLAVFAETREEREAAHKALRLADHELDVAFATRLRVVTSESVPQKGPLRELAERIAQSKTRVTALQKKIEKLRHDAETDDTAADQLALAEAQLSLEEDNLNEAQQDLVRHGGDRRARVKQALAEHEALQKESVQFPHLTEPGTPKTAFEAWQEWFSWRGRADRLAEARQEALHASAKLEQEHNALEKLANGQALPADTDDPDQVQSAVAQLHRLADQRKTLTDL